MPGDTSARRTACRSKAPLLRDGRLEARQPSNGRAERRAFLCVALGAVFVGADRQSMKENERSPLLQLVQQQMNSPCEISGFCNLTYPFMENMFALLNAYHHGHGIRSEEVGKGRIEPPTGR